MVWVDHDTGARATPGARGAILEAFKPGTEPTAARTVLDGGVPDAGGGEPSAAAGPRPPVATSGSGLY